jgi:hypothetical protein
MLPNETSLGGEGSLNYRYLRHLCSHLKVESQTMATAKETTVSLPLPVLPEGWSAEKDFKALGTLTPAIQRNIEPVGPHFLAHARRVS